MVSGDGIIAQVVLFVVFWNEISEVGWKEYGIRAIIANFTSRRHSFFCCMRTNRSRKQTGLLVLVDGLFHYLALKQSSGC